MVCSVIFKISDRRLRFSSGIVEHNEYPDDAIAKFWERLTNLNEDEIIVYHVSSPDRKQWRWNGLLFLEIPVK